MTRYFAASRASWFIAAMIVLLGLSSMVVVAEGEQVVIERLGKPVRVVNKFRPGGASGAGVVLKLPFIEQAVHLSRGLEGTSIGGMKVRTSDAQTLLVDADITYRIIDPVRMVNRLGEPAMLLRQLVTLVPAVSEGRLGTLPAGTVVLPGSGGAAAALRADLDAKAREFGVQIIDFRIGRALPDEATLQLAIDLMQARQQRKAQDIVEQRYANARQMRARVAAEKAGIMQASAGQDPEFYDFFRGLRSYAYVFEQPNEKNPPSIVIPPDSSYLRHFNGR